jgi:adenosylcobinamide amidohydrolase
MTYATAPFERATHADTGAGEPGPMLVWQFEEPLRAVSSGMIGGGISDISWVLNAHVRADYGRMDPAAHLREIARWHGLRPDLGVGLLTAAQVERVSTATDGPQGQQVRCDATVGVSYPTWAAAVDDDTPPETPWQPGTINIVCQLPVPLTDAALVGAVITATEAKTQALVEGGVPGTGTASDAIVVCAPLAASPQHAMPFAGPRSIWGARLARAVHVAVAAGLAEFGADNVIGITANRNPA